MSQIESFPPTLPGPSQTQSKKQKPKRTSFTVSKIAQPTPALCISTASYRSLKWAHRVEAGMCVTVNDTNGKIILEVIKGSELIHQLILSDLKPEVKAVSKLIFSKVSVMIRYPYPMQQDFTQPYRMHRIQLTLPAAQLKGLMALITPFFPPAEDDAAVKSGKGKAVVNEAAKASQPQRAHPYTRPAEEERPNPQQDLANQFPALPRQEPASHAREPFNDYGHDANPAAPLNYFGPAGMHLGMMDANLNSPAWTFRQGCGPTPQTPFSQPHYQMLAPSQFTAPPPWQPSTHSYEDARPAGIPSREPPQETVVPVERHSASGTQSAFVLFQQQQQVPPPLPLLPARPASVSAETIDKHPHALSPTAPSPAAPRSPRITAPPITPRRTEPQLISFDTPSAMASARQYPPMQPDVSQGNRPFEPQAPQPTPLPGLDLRAEDCVVVKIRTASGLSAMNVDELCELLLEVAQEPGFVDLVTKVASAVQMQAELNP